MIARQARTVRIEIVFFMFVFLSESSGRALRSVFLTWSALWPAAFLTGLAHFLWITGLTSTSTTSAVDRCCGLDDEVVLDVSVTGWTFHFSHFTYVY